MGLVQSLSVLALHQLIGDKAERVVNGLANHFTDHSQRVSQSLHRANERAWKSLEVALAGDSWWQRVKGTLARSEDQAFRQQVRAFLDATPLVELANKAEFRQLCLQDLQKARKSGFFSAGDIDVRQAVQLAHNFARFSDPQQLLDAEWQMLKGMARELDQAGYTKLAWLLALRPQQQGPPLLVIAARYFFRREVETDQQLFQGLTFIQVEGLGKSLETGLAALEHSLTHHANRLEEMLVEIQTTVRETHEAVLDIQAEQQKQQQQVQDIYQTVHKLLEQHQLERRELRPGDSLSIRSGVERQLVKAVVARFRGLPGDQQRQLPALLNALGKLQVVAGDFEPAQRDFQQVAALVSDPAARAEALINAYRAALERRDWADALQQLLQAASLDPRRFAPFPLDKYQPQRILGAGGFGVAFLCQHRYMNAPVVVKALMREGLDCDIRQVFVEAQMLKQLDHPAIIRLQDCGYADDAGQAHPYLVLDYFDGMTLEQYVSKHGPLPPAELLALARPVAEALQAAHAQGILHRDVKPANLLVYRAEGERGMPAPRWQVKLIDFGLALRHSALQNTISNPGVQAHTIVGSSIAGTLEYAAPEQLGRLQGVAVGPYTDVYGFARTCCYALFKTTQPQMKHWSSLPRPLAELLDRCLSEQPEERPASFRVVLDRLAALGGPPPQSPKTSEVYKPSEVWDAILLDEQPPKPPPVLQAILLDEPPVKLAATQVVKPHPVRPRILSSDVSNGRLVTNLEPDKAFALLCQAFVDYKVGGLAVDNHNLSVSGKTGLTLMSWGQSVSGQVIRCGEGTLITISSAPRAQLFDWGRGKKEAREIMELVIERMRRLG